MSVTVIFFLVSAYLLGSIPNAVWYGRIFFGIDVREHGSGNAGATNMLRTFGNKAGFVVFFLDFLKGFIATKLPDWFSLCDKIDLINYQMMFAVCAVIGHMLPVFAQFKGGKGIAVLFAGVFAMDYRVALICISFFILFVAVTKFISVGSMIGSCISPFVVGFLYNWREYGFMAFCAAIGVMVVHTHRKNIRRLIAGNENKFTFSKKGSQ